MRIFLPLLAALTMLSSAQAGPSYPLKITMGGHGASSKTTGFNNLSPLTTKGDIIGHNGTNNVRLGVGSNGQFLKANSAASTGFEWATGAAQMYQVTLPYSGPATGDTTPVSGSAPNWTFTTPAGVTRLLVCGHGGGGGGGGGGFGCLGVSGKGGWGGGGAASVCIPVSVTASTAYAVTIGAGGAGGSSGPPSTNGASGGNSTFGSLATFRGAQGGKKCEDSTTNYATAIQYQILGGKGGNGAEGEYNTSAMSGQASPFALGGSVSGSTNPGGGGGGGDGAGGNSFSNGTDGGGGGGGESGGSAGNGGNGKIVVIWTI